MDPVMKQEAVPNQIEDVTRQIRGAHGKFYTFGQCTRPPDDPQLLKPL